MSKICCVYTRCSPNEQARGEYSLEYQEEKCKEYIQNKKYKYFRTYTDAGISGNVPWDKREGMNQLIQDMKLERFDTIVLHTFDRLGCTMIIAYKIIGILENYQINILECQHDIDTSTTDGNNRMAMSLTISYAERLRSMEGSKEREEAEDIYFSNSD